jgi:hypothetical protein
MEFSLGRTGVLGVSPKILLISPFFKGGLRGIRDRGD